MAALLTASRTVLAVEPLDVIRRLQPKKKFRGNDEKV